MDCVPMEQTTLVWFSLSTVIIGGLLTFAAGFLIGLSCGMRHGSPSAAEPTPSETARKD